MKTRKKGRMMWSLQGEKNTAYFHVVANNKCNKINIFTLYTPNGRLTNKEVRQAHVNDYYGDLLVSEVSRACDLALDSWGAAARVSHEEDENIALTLSNTELEENVKEMKYDTAGWVPGPVLQEVMALDKN
jgi:hypothetical protein